MKTLAITISLFLLASGCVKSDAPEIHNAHEFVNTIADIVIAEYELLSGVDVPDECYDFMYRVEFVDYDEEIYEGINYTLGDPELDGAVHYSKPRKIGYIWIDETVLPSRKNACIGHEMIHMLMRCLTDGKDGDSDHNEPEVWCHEEDGVARGCYMDGSEDEINTLEYKVTEIVYPYHIDFTESQQE